MPKAGGPSRRRGRRWVQNSNGSTTQEKSQTLSIEQVRAQLMALPDMTPEEIRQAEALGQAFVDNLNRNALRGTKDN